ncbi:MAG TPA: hypothetical protein DCL77_17195 [Prolixibacteraceae bacterium]|jgi:hypothetical protein|nr:hypothetical protein [Prolixibacteraceae bacterium]
MQMRYFLLIFLSMLIFQPRVDGQSLSPTASVSILTCNPGTDVYSMYGHTAIRVSDPSMDLDAVYNYGVFSFETPNFMLRFAKGQTDYLMVGEKFSSFMREYNEDKRSVYEQVLNLSAEGKNKLFNALVENAKPENREYRYNFFIDNCATRVRDMIERNAGGTVHFTDNHPTESYRDLIKKFHHSFRWIDLGIDLLVGKKADVPVSAYGQMFLPDYLKDQFAKAEITFDGNAQPLVLETRTLVEFPNSKQNSDLPWPAIVFGIIFLLVAAISVRGYLRKTNTDWLDYWLLALTGIAGLIIGWFTLYSEHPAMSPNYNLLWAFPPNLLFAFVWKNQKWRSKTRFYFWLTGALLLLSFVMGQQFNPAVYFIILTLLVRVVVNMKSETRR